MSKSLGLRAPSVTSSPEELADWVELLALASADQNSSLTDLSRSMRAGGTIDALPFDDDDPDLTDSGNEILESVAASAFEECEDRATAAGQTAYPFSVREQYLQADTAIERSVYAFLLLLSTQGIDAGPTGFSATELFEDLAAEAGKSYFGGHLDGVEAYQFGFPRRRALAGFKPALNELCGLMSEGGGARQRPTSRDQKDAKLDLVVWRAFPDRRGSQIIGFGQCAAGSNWDEKLAELQPRTFAGAWMTSQILVEPTRLFFCPHRIERDRWDVTALSAGVLFERCRMAWHCRAVKSELLDRCEAYNRHVIQALTEAIAV